MIMRSALLAAGLCATVSAVTQHAGSVIAPKGVLSFPVKASAEPQSTNSRREHSRRQLREPALIGASNTIYTVEIEVGTPGQSVQLLVHTGASELWVNPHDAHRLVHLRGIQYPEGYVEFNYYYDSMKFGGSTMNQQIFGVAYDSEYFVAGVLPLAPSLSGWDSPYPFLLDNAYYQGLINSRTFSLDLRAGATEGSLILGGIDSGRYVGNLQRVPIVPAASSPDGFVRYWVQLDRVAYTIEGDEDVVISSGPLIVNLDSSSPLSVLPTSVFQSLLEAFPSAILIPGSNLYSVDCSDRDIEGSVDFTFGSKTIKVPFKDFLLEMDGQCILGAVQNDFYSVLGSSFLKAAYVVFDWDNRAVHFAQSFPGECEPRLLANTQGPDAVPSERGGCDLAPEPTPTPIPSPTTTPSVAPTTTTSGSSAPVTTSTLPSTSALSSSTTSTPVSSPGTSTVSSTRSSASTSASASTSRVATSGSSTSGSSTSGSSTSDSSTTTTSSVSASTASTTTTASTDSSHSSSVTLTDAVSFTSSSTATSSSTRASETDLDISTTVSLSSFFSSPESQGQSIPSTTTTMGHTSISSSFLQSTTESTESTWTSVYHTEPSAGTKTRPTGILSPSLTTETSKTTTTYVVTSCPDTVIDCPIGHVTTETLIHTTVYCPQTTGTYTLTHTQLCHAADCSYGVSDPPVETQVVTVIPHSTNDKPVSTTTGGPRPHVSDESVFTMLASSTSASPRGYGDGFGKDEHSQHLEPLPTGQASETHGGTLSTSLTSTLSISFVSGTPSAPVSVPTADAATLRGRSMLVAVVAGVAVTFSVI